MVTKTFPHKKLPRSHDNILEEHFGSKMFLPEKIRNILFLLMGNTIGERFKDTLQFIQNVWRNNVPTFTNSGAGDSMIQVS